MILNGTGIASIEELIKGPSVRNAVKSIDEEYGDKTFYRKEKSLIWCHTGTMHEAQKY
jgi:hypothetical protein